ncbi:MAG: DegT/DnrJ/EryC1/StrS family aminotransferase [Candidatus Zixiibacteriota bacterium]|nr:MAG: DegT/DnrJ/EryC1/StrS family aminotransferase [candidate division Zixibacteria bacterium]
MKIPPLDLKRQYASIKNEIDSAIQNVLNHGGFVLGPEVKELESKLAEYCNTKNGVGVASGTDALLLSLMVAGIKPGDEVITSTFTFFATAGVISRLGAKPVFVDIDPDTFNIDPELIEKAVTPKTRAIIPVHLYGQSAEMDEIVAAAKKHDIPIIEDAAQAVGSTYKGKKAGSFGLTGCFSFYPTKNLGGYGDGGFISTDDDETADLLRRLRLHGARPKYFHSIIGINSRLDSMQAAALLVKLKHLPEWHEARRTRARHYDNLLSDIDQVKTPFVRDYNYHIYHQYTILAEKRDALKEYLKSKDIGCEIYYPVPMHLQECFKYLGYAKGSMPAAEKASEMALSLPIFPELTDREQDYIAETIKEFYKA